MTDGKFRGLESLVKRVGVWRDPLPGDVMLSD
jgi:hypothetical protein